MRRRLPLLPRPGRLPTDACAHWTDRDDLPAPASRRPEGASPSAFHESGGPFSPPQRDRPHESDPPPKPEARKPDHKAWPSRPTARPPLSEGSGKGRLGANTPSQDAPTRPARRGARAPATLAVRLGHRTISGGPGRALDERAS